MRLVIATFAITFLAGCPKPQPKTGCTTDVECKGQRICVSRICQDPPEQESLVDAGPADASPRVGGAPPFAMFQGNAQNTGVLAGPAPETQPSLLWTIKLGQPIVGSPTIGPSGSIYFTSHDGNLYAADPAGNVLWKFATSDRVWSTPAISEDGTVYIGSDDDNLYAVDGATGKEKWHYRVGNCASPKAFGPEGVRCDVDGGPTLGPDGTIYTGGDGVYAVWPNGTLRWKFATPEHVRATPALAEDGTVYATCLDDALYAIRPDGTKAWELRTRGDIESAPTIGSDGEIYFGSDDGAIYAVNPDGNVRWKVVTTGDVRASAAVDAVGNVFIGSHDGRLYAISKSGQVMWRFAAADKIHASVGMATNGVLLVGSQDDHLYALGRDGRLLWYLSFGADVDTTPAVSSDGIVYVGTDDGILSAFKGQPK